MSITIERQQHKPSDLSRSIQVVAAGYSRTGTVSLCRALEILLHGQVCHSGSAVLLRETSFIKSWIRILDPGPSTTPTVVKSTLKTLLAGYVAVADAPAVLFCGELTEVYPDCKVICTVRDKERWWVSYQDVVQTLNHWWMPIVFLVMPVSWYHKKKDRAVGKRSHVVYDIGENDRLHTPELQSIHNDYVKRVVPPERLLIFDVKQGWEPVCKFLDLPVPEEPFPHENDHNSLHAQINSMALVAAKHWMFIFAGLSVAGGVLGHVLKKK